MLTCINCKYCYNFLWNHSPQSILTCTCLVVHKMPKWYSCSHQVFFNMSFIRAHKLTCLVLESGKDSVLDEAPKEKNQRHNIFRVRRPGCWFFSLFFQFTDPEMFHVGNYVLRNSSEGVLHVAEKAVQWIVAIRHAKENFAGTGISLRHSPSYEGVTCWTLQR